MHRHPNRNAFLFIEKQGKVSSITYKDLYDETCKKTYHLLNNLSNEKTCLLIYPPGLEFICTLLACMMSGIAAIPLAIPKPRHSQNLKHILINSKSKTILTSSDLSNRLLSFTSQPDLPEDIEVMSTDVFPDSHLISDLPAISTERMAIVQYTSGSTGNPKGTMITHANILHNVRAISRHFQLNEESVSFSWLPHYHDMGLFDGIIQPLYNGCLGILTSPMLIISNPELWFDIITQYKVTHTGGPNFFFDLCVDKVRKSNKTWELTNLKDTYVSAEPVRWDTLERFTASFSSYGFAPNIFTPGYGLAEATLMVTCKKMGTDLRYSENPLDTKNGMNGSIKVVNLGKPIPDMSIRIVNPNTLEELPDGEVGEVWLKGPSVAMGYLNSKKQTQNTFRATMDHKTDNLNDHYLRTGDLGFMENECLYITGRLKNLIIIRGVKYPSEDIELELSQCHHQLRPIGCVAFSVEKANSEQIVVLQEVHRQAIQSLELKNIQLAMKDKIFHRFGLTGIQVNLVLPGSVHKTTSGKPRRSYCKNEYLSGNFNVLEQFII